MTAAQTRPTKVATRIHSTVTWQPTDAVVNANAMIANSPAAAIRPAVALIFSATAVCARTIATDLANLLIAVTTFSVTAAGSQASRARRRSAS